jgi:hypothetical protein
MNGQELLKNALSALTKAKKKVGKGIRKVTSKAWDFLETSNYYQKDAYGNFVNKEAKKYQK